MSVFEAQEPCPRCGATTRQEYKDGVVMCVACGAELRRHVLTHQDSLFLRAVELGCTPEWTGNLWVCKCPMCAHGVSTTYTAITVASLERAAVEL